MTLLRSRISGNTKNFLLTIPNLAERWHFYTLNTLKKVQIPFSGCSWNLGVSHGSIVEHFKQQRVTFITVKDIWKYTNFLLMIPSLVERWYFYTLNALKKVQISISCYFGTLRFTHGSIVEHFKQQWVTLLRSGISENIQIFFWRYQI